MQPSGECRFTAKRPNLAKKLEERLLGQILGFSCIGCHPQAQRVNPPLVLIVEGLERLGVPLFGPFDQLGFNRITGLSLFWVGQVAFSGRTP